MSTNYTDFNIIQESPSSPETTIVLVGAALDGPSRLPFSLLPEVDPYEKLGNSPLAEAYNAARRAGAESIIAYRLNGKHSVATLIDRNGKSLLTLRTVSASSKYNEIQVVLYPTHLYVVDTRGIPRSYFFERFKTVSELVYAINLDAHYGLSEFTALSIDEYAPLANIVDIPSEMIFSGGDEEDEYINSRDPLSEKPTNILSTAPLLKAGLARALFGEDPVDIAERQPATELGVLRYGVITVCDFYIDDDPEIAEMLGAFCMNKVKELNYGCVGVIGTRPLYRDFVFEDDSDTYVEGRDFDDLMKERVDELIALSQSLTDKEAYKYLQVVVGHTAYPETTETSLPTSYAYAATQAISPYHTMMTNKSLKGIGKLNFEMKKEHIALLSANGYTCIVPSIRRGFVPFYATSFSKDKGSLMAKPHNLRISQYVSGMLSDEMDSLIGNSYVYLTVQDSIEMAQEQLNDLIQTKVIRSYSLEHELFENNTKMTLSVSLVPFSEVEALSSIAVISFPRGVEAI